MAKKYGIFMVMAVLVSAFAGSSAIAGPQVDIHGFVSQGWIQSDNNNFLAETEDGTAEFNEVGINFQSELSDSLRVGIQFLSRDLGEYGNNEVVIDWAYGDYRLHDAVGIRAGKLKMPFGLYNETRDLDMLRVPILLPQSVYMEAHREVTSSMWGAEIYGFIPAGSLGDFSYAAFAGEINVVPDSGIGRLFEDLGALSSDEIDIDRLHGGALQWDTPMPGLKLSATWARTELYMNGTITDAVALGTGLPVITPAEYKVEDLEISTYSAEWTIQNLTLVYEHYYLHAHPKHTIFVSEVAPMPDMVSDSLWRNEGWYGQISYWFTDSFALSVYHSELYDDWTDKEGENLEDSGRQDWEGWRKDTAVTARFDLTDYWLLKLEYHKMDGVLDLNSFSPVDEPVQHWNLYAAKTTFYF